jgi:hypothetical protein
MCLLTMTSQPLVACRHGKGLNKWSDGSTYIGTYRKGRRHGKGEHRSIDGKLYNGDWKDDKR